MISIIIPVFNAASTLEATLKSALNSGLKSQEIIVIDDGSTDNSWDLISGFVKNNSNVFAYQNKRNLGGGASRNLGIKESKFDYIFVLDSDDLLIPGALSKSLDQLIKLNADGIANAKSTFFVDDFNKVIREINYKPGLYNFSDLVSAVPNPITINLLFKKSAYFTAGGYPENHGFDTQGFGFRLLANKLKIFVGDYQIYYQRIPRAPSYYIREAKAGNIGKNWFYIFSESLYKFSPSTREKILKFQFSDPKLLAQGRHLFNELIALSYEENIFSSEGLSFSDEEAYKAYNGCVDETLKAWCVIADFKKGRIETAFQELNTLMHLDYRKKLLYPLLSDYLNKLSADDIDDVIYFFASKKTLIWKIYFYKQKVLNRLKSFFSLIFRS
jgi:glycosyltransferase involved in cell wall biosynthesis